MRPTPVAAGFQPCRPGKVWLASNEVCSADPNRDTLSAMPLAATYFTNSRRDVRMLASSSALQCLSRVHFSANRHPSGSNGIVEAHGDVAGGSKADIRPLSGYVRDH